MATYDLAQNLDADEEGAISVAADWVICVIRFKHVNTYSRANKSSVSLDGSEAAAEAGDPLIITNDCISVTTSASKSSHVKTLAATLVPGEINYATSIFPGDWVLCWMVQDEDRAADLVKRIRSRRPTNEFLDGLKFVGRVYSGPQLDLAINPGSGQKVVHYQLQALGFSEFDTQIFWDPYLAKAETFLNTWLGNVGIAINKFLSKDGIDVNGAIPELVEVLFGRGISKHATNAEGSSQLQAVTGSTEGDGDAPFAYVVPATVGSLLGQQSRSKTSGVLAYADLLTATYGVQKYSAQEGIESRPEDIFLPQDLKPMLGKFLPAIPQFNGRSLWSVLGQYLNSAVNEMYTCLRINGSGRVLPTLVVRQLPFSSPDFTTEETTGFLELPRWKVPTSMLYGVQVGRSGALRFNFIHLLGQAPAQTLNNNFTKQLIYAPPVRDDQDIRRSGVYADFQIVACGIEDQETGPKKWMDLRADWLMGQHLTLTGTLTCLGIQEPICEGDNLEFDGVVFHIESVSHNGSISPDGRKVFMTTLALSHGMRADPILGGNDIGLYAGTQETDLTANNPGLTVEGGDTKPEILGDFFSGTDGSA